MNELAIKLIIIIPIIGLLIWVIVFAIKLDIENSNEIGKYTQRLFNSFTTTKDNGMVYEMKEKVKELSLKDYVDVLRTKIWTEICDLECYQHYESNELCILLHPNDFNKFQAVLENSFKLNKLDAGCEYSLYGVMIKSSNEIKERDYKVTVKSIITPTVDWNGYSSVTINPSGWYDAVSIPQKETEKEVCDGCGAPITGQVCEYCGRVHWR